MAIRLHHHHHYGLCPSTPHCRALHDSNSSRGLSRLKCQSSPLLSTLHSLHRLRHKPWPVGGRTCPDGFLYSPAFLCPQIQQQGLLSHQRTPCSSLSLGSTHAVCSAGISCSRCHWHLHGRCLSSPHLPVYFLAGAFQELCSPFP